MYFVNKDEVDNDADKIGILAVFPGSCEMIEDVKNTSSKKF